MRLDPKIKTRLLKQIKNERTSAQEYFDSEMYPAIMERIKAYDADESYYREMFPLLSEQSSLRDTSVADAVRWIMPYLGGIFCGGSEYLSLTGESHEDNDDLVAASLQKLIDVQLQKQTHAFETIRTVLQSGLICNWGVVKVGWEQEKEVESEQDIPFNLSLEEDRMQIDHLMASGSDLMEVSEPEEVAPGVVTVNVKQYRYKKNQPVLWNVPPEEFLMSNWNALHIDDCRPIHRRKVLLDELRRRAREGVYDAKALKEIEKKGPDGEDELHDETYHEEHALESVVPDGTAEYWLYEHYTKFDINDDGLLEDIAVTVVRDEILLVQDREGKRHPFFVNSPHIEPHRIFPKASPLSSIMQLQHLATAFIRQAVIATAQNNDTPRIWDASKVNMDDVYNGMRDVECRGPVEAAVKDLPPRDISNLTMIFLKELIPSWKQDRTGVSRILQGDVSGSLNKTARGVRDILNTANKVINDMALVIAETCMKPLYRYLVDLNLEYMDQDTLVRLTNTQVPIEEVDREWDIEVDSGFGMLTKEMGAQLLGQFMQTAVPMGGQAGILGPMEIRNLLDKFGEYLGIPSRREFLPSKEDLAQQLQQQQLQQQQMMAQQGPPGMPQSDEMQSEMNNQMMSQEMM
jgi:hypothetical protein